MAQNNSLVKLLPHNEFSRYLDLFVQLNIIEESFEFVHLIFYLDPFQCVYAGDTFEKIYGYSCKEMYERTEIFYEAAHPDDSAFLMQQFNALLKNGYDEFTYRIITKNGEVKRLKVNAWCKQETNLSYVINCFQKDVTDLAETDGYLKKSRQKHYNIADIAITLNSVDDFEHKLQNVINKIGHTVQVDQVSLYEIDNAHRQMVCSYIWAGQNVLVPKGYVAGIPPLDKLPEYISTLQFSTGERLSGFMRFWHKPPQVQSLMVFPIRIKQKMFGFIELAAAGKKRKWNDDDLSFTCTVSSMTANFYDRKSINDELNQNYLNQELLASVSSRFNQYADDNEHVLSEVFRYIGEKKPKIEHLFIFRYDEDNCFRKTHEYTNTALGPTCGFDEECRADRFPDMVNRLKSGEIFAVEDTALHKNQLQAVFGKSGTKSLLVIPLSVNGQFYGIYGQSTFTYYRTWRKGEIKVNQSFVRNISYFIERQSIIKKLKDSEQKFANISANLPGCVFQITLSPNEEITINYISPQFRQWSGAPPPVEISLRRVHQFVHQADYEAFSKLKDDLLRFHSDISFEGRFYFSAVGFKWLIIKLNMLEIKPSGDLVYNGMFIDVTENKQTEAKLAEANISIQSIIGNLETGVLLVDDFDNVLYSNAKLMDMLASAGEMSDDPEQQNRILSATYHLVRDHAGLRNHTSDLMRKRIEEKGYGLFLYKSAEFVVRDYIPVFRAHRFFAHLFIFSNITHTKLQELEVQKSNKRLRTIIDYSDIGVLLLSENGKILTVNNRFLKLFHISEPANNYVDQLFRILWDKMEESVKMEGISRDMIRETVHSGKRIINREILVNGTSTLQVFIEPVVSEIQPQSEMNEILIQVVDVTAQREIEQTLRRAKEEAEDTASAKTHILTLMSHEIRTPLNGILGFSGMLKEILADPYQREMADVIELSGHRLLETLNAILDFSAVQSEKKSFRIASVNVNRMLLEQINLYRTAASQKGLFLYAEIEGQIDIAIAEQVLYKILNNLINNGVKYTITGGVKIEANITKVNGSDWLEIKVIDTGVGITEEKHKTIFEPFRQESEGYGRVFEGTGLGLSLVKEYVHKMNGKIYLDSRKEEGSTFTILLPDAYYDRGNTSAEVIGILPGKDNREYLLNS